MAIFIITNVIEQEHKDKSKWNILLDSVGVKGLKKIWGKKNPQRVVHKSLDPDNKHEKKNVCTTIHTCIYDKVKNLALNIYQWLGFLLTYDVLSWPNEANI